MRLWNVYSFFVTYANLDNWVPTDVTTQYSLLDRWILSKLQVVVQYVTKGLIEYDAYSAAAVLERFVDDLSTWFVRRSRRRFWKSEADKDKKAGYTALHNCLTTVTKLLAPFIPFMAEEMYQNLVVSVDTDVPESVHHNDWPVVDRTLIDEELMEDMDLAMKVCSLAHSARNKTRIKLRQPMKEVKVVAEKKMLERLERLRDLIKDELNVKMLNFTTQEKELVDHKIVPLLPILGKKYGSLLPELRKAIVGLDANSVLQMLEEHQGLRVKVDNKVITLLPEEFEVRAKPKEGYKVVGEEDITVGVYTKITNDLKKEGLAREIVRRIQNQRKEARFAIADHIKVYYEAGPSLTEVFKTHENYIASETLATSITQARIPKGAYIAHYKVDEKPLKIGVIRRNDDIN